MHKHKKRCNNYSNTNNVNYLWYIDFIDSLNTVYNDLYPMYSVGYDDSYKINKKYNNEEIIYYCKLPGFCKKDIEVNIEGYNLSIRGTLKDDILGEHTIDKIIEVQYGYDINKSKCKFKNGVLYIIIPKINDIKKISID